MKKLLNVLFLLVTCSGLFAQSLNVLRTGRIESDKIKFLNSRAEDCYNRGQYDSVIIYHEYAYDIAIKYGLIEEKCFALKEIGGMNELMGNYPKALEYLFASLSIAEENNLRSLEAAININIGIVYYNLKNAEKAIEHDNKALVISEAENDTVLIVKSLNNLGNANMTLLNEWQIAEDYFNRCVFLAEKIGFSQAAMVGMNNLCQIYMNSGREKEALDVTNRMLEQHPYNPYIYYNLGNLYRQNGDNIKAISYLLQALKLSEYEIELRQVLLKDISDIEYENGNFDNSIEYYKEYSTLKDSVHSNDQAKYALELEAKYKNLKKETEISELKAQSLKSKRYNTIVISSAVIILLISGFVILIIYNKKTVAAQKVKVLENEKIIVSAKAALSGEERERARLSRELHDGLGGILSGVKLSLANTMEKPSGSDITPEELKKSYNLVVSSITELRRVSNALLPETLLNLGLNTAIKSYCDTFRNQGNAFTLSYSFFGQDIRYARFFELAVYRLAQEIINNAVKHSAAELINVQLIVDDDRLFLGVQDNGKGFDMSVAGKKGGLGLSNLKQRAEVYGGRVDVISEPGAGTEVIVEFNNLKDNKTVYDKSSDS